MPIDFHAVRNRYSYATREAHPTWVRTVTSIVPPQGKRVVDVGCGGGTYAHAWRQSGAAEVTGVDFSEQMVQAATERFHEVPHLSFRRGDAAATGLRDGCADIVFARALIHHLAGLSAAFGEAYRLLAPGGVYIVQERTPEDIQQAASRGHIRGYFFERFPRLLAVEMSRRPRVRHVMDRLRQAGFTRSQTLTFWETRRIYPDVTALAADLAARTGRSILHELDDAELAELIAFITRQMPQDEAIVEQDRWTLWWASRP
jgi:ubiquinone/menaquinone biosynthesis C-methylase UbiE